MESYRDAAKTAGAELGKTYLEAETATLAIVGRLKKYLLWRISVPRQNHINGKVRKDAV
jgi:hypothetical protein